MKLGVELGGDTRGAMVGLNKMLNLGVERVLSGEIKGKNLEVPYCI